MNNNLAESAWFPDAPKKGNYKLLQRILTKQRIYKMILDGHSYANIMRELGISERTLYRYIDVIFKQEVDLRNEILTGEQLRRQIILCRDRLLDDRLAIKEWLRDNPNAGDRTALMNLAAELTAAVLRLYDKAPAKFIRTETHEMASAAVAALEEEGGGGR